MSWRWREAGAQPAAIQNRPKTMTPAQRQAAFRARKIDSPEVRGIFAHPDDHARIKAYAARLAKKREKTS